MKYMYVHPSFTTASQINALGWIKSIYHWNCGFRGTVLYPLYECWKPFIPLIQRSQVDSIDIRMAFLFNRTFFFICSVQSACLDAKIIFVFWYLFSLGTFGPRIENKINWNASIRIQNHRQCVQRLDIWFHSIFFFSFSQNDCNLNVGHNRIV